MITPEPTIEPFPPDEPCNVRSSLVFGLPAMVSEAAPGRGLGAPAPGLRSRPRLLSEVLVSPSRAAFGPEDQPSYAWLAPYSASAGVKPSKTSWSTRPWRENEV
jgi:hypothetical protein